MHLSKCDRYVENGSLERIVTKFGPFPEHLIAVYIAQVLEGLVYLHEQGVIHRDIKGANILTTKTGHIKLADFGIATKQGTNDEFEEPAGSPYWSTWSRCYPAVLLKFSLSFTSQWHLK